MRVDIRIRKEIEEKAAIISLMKIYQMISFLCFINPNARFAIFDKNDWFKCHKSIFHVYYEHIKSIPLSYVYHKHLNIKTIIMLSIWIHILRSSFNRFKLPVERKYRDMLLLSISKIYFLMRYIQFSILVNWYFLNFSIGKNYWFFNMILWFWNQ